MSDILPEFRGRAAAPVSLLRPIRHLKKYFFDVGNLPKKKICPVDPPARRHPAPSMDVWVVILQTTGTGITDSTVSPYVANPPYLHDELNHDESPA